jgi:hypothetical protein
VNARNYLIARKNLQLDAGYSYSQFTIGKVDFKVVLKDWETCLISTLEYFIFTLFIVGIRARYKVPED